MAAPQMQTPGGNQANANNQTHAADFNALDKPAATLVAKLAFAGHVVHRGKCGDFTVSKWGMSRYCQDLAELQDFARRLGVIA